MRSSTADELERLAKPHKLGLEEALEFCAVDECVEVAPTVVRVRKATLDGAQRAKDRSRAKARDRAN
jgi:GTP-binding protein